MLQSRQSKLKVVKFKRIRDCRLMISCPVSSSSGYETGSEKEAGPAVKEERRSSDVSLAAHTQPFLRVGGAAYPRTRRRSLSVNR